jgi:tRNA (guanine10-N2)-dimethyltransferase
VIDPFCGSATILIEAAAVAARVLGGDLEGAMLDEARVNIAEANVPAGLMRWDGRKLPLKRGAADAVVTNLPWGRQVQVDADLKRLYAQAFAEMRRITRPGGKIVILSSQPELLPEAPAQTQEISLFGQNPRILLFGG